MRDNEYTAETDPKFAPGDLAWFMSDSPAEDVVLPGFVEVLDAGYNTADRVWRYKVDSALQGWFWVRESELYAVEYDREDWGRR